MAAELTADYPTAQATSQTRLVWRRRLAKATRWLHIYGSMASFTVVLFFAVTGITLNHQDWFAGQQVTTAARGTLNAAWLKTGDAAGMDKLAVVEFLRTTHGLHGAVSDFRIDDAQADVAFKGPGYSADIVIDRASGQYDLTQVTMGFAAIVNDLHKGRDTGGGWRVGIDVAAGLLVFVSLSGLVLLYFVHRHRFAGVIVLGVGTVVLYGLYRILVP
jgi:uncharacterized protein